MKHTLQIGFLLILTVSNTAYADGRPEEFFRKFVQLGNSFDPSVASLYSDSARIHAYRVYPHGLERNMELTGKQWKQLVTKVMPIAKSKNDRSTFSNTVVTKQDIGYKIKADRYSVRKCYTDTGYYMIIEPDINGQFSIVEEYMETRPQPNC